MAMKTLLIIVLIVSANQLYAQADTDYIARYTELKCGLYQNKKGDIGFKTTALTDDLGNHRTIFQTHLYLVDEDDQREYQPVAFRHVVDTATFQILSDFYCKDKTYVYAIFYTSSGAMFNATKQIDLASFRVYDNSTYASDKLNIYYRTEIMKMADYKTFRAIDGNENGAYDKENYYLDGELLSLKDAKAMGFDKKKN